MRLHNYDDEEIDREWLRRNSGVLDEPLDLIAEAACTSRHAKLAYSRLREVWPEIETLEARQRLIQGRMGEAA